MYEDRHSHRTIPESFSTPKLQEYMVRIGNLVGIFCMGERFSDFKKNHFKKSLDISFPITIIIAIIKK